MELLYIDSFHLYVGVTIKSYNQGKIIQFLSFFSSVQHYLIGTFFYSRRNIITNQRKIKIIFSKSLYFLEIVKHVVDGLRSSSYPKFFKDFK